MKLIETTTTQQHIRKLEEFSDTENRAIAAAISVLNNSYNYLWSLPDNELVSVLQELLNTGKLQGLFEIHYITATSLNNIQDNTGYGGPRAITIAGKKINVSNQGIISIECPVLEEIIPDPIIEDPME